MHYLQLKLWLMRCAFICIFTFVYVLCSQIILGHTLLDVCWNSPVVRDTASTQTGLHKIDLLTFITEKSMSSISLVIFYFPNCLTGTWMFITIIFIPSWIFEILQNKLKQTKIKQHEVAGSSSSRNVISNGTPSSWLHPPFLCRPAAAGIACSPKLAISTAGSLVARVPGFATVPEAPELTTGLCQVSSQFLEELFDSGGVWCSDGLGQGCMSSPGA